MSFLKIVERDLLSLAKTFAGLPEDFKSALPTLATFAHATAPLVETGLALSGNAPAAAITSAVVTAIDASVTASQSPTKDALQVALQTSATLAQAVGAPTLADHINNVAVAVNTANPVVNTSIIPQAVQSAAVPVPPTTNV